MCVCARVCVCVLVCACVCPTLEEKGESKRGIEPTSSFYQPNALPLGQTGSHTVVSWPHGYFLKLDFGLIGCEVAVVVLLLVLLLLLFVCYCL